MKDKKLFLRKKKKFKKKKKDKIRDFIRIFDEFF